MKDKVRHGLAFFSKFYGVMQQEMLYVRVRRTGKLGEYVIKALLSDVSWLTLIQIFPDINYGIRAWH